MRTVSSKSRTFHQLTGGAWAVWVCFSVCGCGVMGERDSSAGNRNTPQRRVETPDAKRTLEGPVGGANYDGLFLPAPELTMQGPGGSGNTEIQDTTPRPNSSNQARKSQPGDAPVTTASLQGGSAEGNLPPLAPAVQDDAVSFLPPPLQLRDPALLEVHGVRQALDYLRIGQARQASILLQSIRRQEEESLELANLHVWSLLEMGERDEALRLAETLATTGGSRHVGTGFVYASSLYMVDRKAEAMPWYQQCLQYFDEDAALLQRAARCAMEVKDGDFALQCLDRLTVLQPLNDELSLMRARALSLAGRHDAALNQFDALLRDKSTDPALWDEAGMIAMVRADALQDDPNSFDPLAPYRDAADYFREAIGLHPQGAIYQLHIGMAYASGGELDSAVLAFNRAIELRPGYMEAVEALVDLLEEEGRLAEARSVLQQHLRQPLAPGEIERTQARLQNLGQQRVSGS